MSETRTYEIGGRMFVQRELVLGQWRQLKNALKGVEIVGELGEGDGRLQRIVDALDAAGRLDTVAAVLLTEEGTALKDKDVPALAEFLEFHITAAQLGEVISDFFICNPVNSILSQLGGVLTKMVAIVILGIQEIGSRRRASCSPAATGADETASCGDAPRVTPCPGLSTENAS